MNTSGCGPIKVLIETDMSLNAKIEDSLVNIM